MEMAAAVLAVVESLVVGVVGLETAVAETAFAGRVAGRVAGQVVAVAGGYPL